MNRRNFFKQTAIAAIAAGVGVVAKVSPIMGPTSYMVECSFDSNGILSALSAFKPILSVSLDGGKTFKEVAVVENQNIEHGEEHVNITFNERISERML